MKVTNLRSYSVAALLVSGVLSLACGSSGDGGGSGGSSGDGGGKNTGGTSSGGTSSGGSGNAGSSDKPAPGELCKRFAEIQCAGEAACCSSPGRTMSACQMAQEMACGQGALSLDAVAMDPTTGFDMTKSNAAFAKFDDLAKKCDTTIAAFGLSADGFRGIAAGTVDAGGTCNPAMNGSPMAAATAAALVSCKDPATNACLPAPKGTDWKCTARQDTGGKCFTDANCKDGLYCDNPGFTLSGGMCAARKSTGADCTLGNECTSLACSKDGKCLDSTKDTAYCLAPAM